MRLRQSDGSMNSEISSSATTERRGKEIDRFCSTLLAQACQSVMSVS